MNETDLHFKINEYLIKLETKRDLIKELKIELENLEIKNKELYQTKDKLKKEYKKNEKNNKKLENLSNFINSELSNNINNNNNIKKKRNNSATISKRRFSAEIIKEMKNKNEELNKALIKYKNELNRLIKQVNEKEVNCRLLMLNINSATNFYSKK